MAHIDIDKLKEATATEIDDSTIRDEKFWIFKEITFKDGSKSIMRWNIGFNYLEILGITAMAQAQLCNIQDYSKPVKKIVGTHIESEVVFKDKTK